MCELQLYSLKSALFVVTRASAWEPIHCNEPLYWGLINAIMMSECGSLSHTVMELDHGVEVAQRNHDAKVRTSGVYIINPLPL